MATTTTNYGLKKPAGTDAFNIVDFNTNSDTIDSALNTISNKADTKVAKDDYTKAAGYAVDSSSSANAIAVTLSPAPTAYVDGMRVLVKVNYANSSSTVTINVNSLGAKNILSSRGENLIVGELASNYTYEFVYSSSINNSAGGFILEGSGLNSNTLKGYTPAQVASQSTDYIRTPGYAVDIGTADAYSISISPVPGAYLEGQRYCVKISNKNTTTVPTLNVNSMGTKIIYRADGSALAAGDLISGCIYEFIYISSTFRLTGITKSYIDSAEATLTNKTLTSPKINEAVVLSATSTELNTLHGITVSTAELNYVDGVTSAIQTQLDAKAEKSMTVLATLTSAGWVGSAAPYTQTVTIAGMTASANGLVQLSQSANQAARNAASVARLNPTAQAENSITITADGTKPTVDIPIAVLILG